ncbi:MAG TPA: hypothetical protein VF362_04355, partial [Demequinaceae bacterium]
CDGGPDFGTPVEVTNRCDVDLAIAFQTEASPGPTRSTTKEASRLKSGESSGWLLAPITGYSHGIQYMWVTNNGSATWGDPVEVDLRTLPEGDLSGGQAERVLVIEGDLCPR